MRPVLDRVRAGWPVLLAAFAVLLASVTLITAGVVYGDAVAVGGVQRALADASPAGRAMLITTAVPPTELLVTDAAARTELLAAMMPTGGSVSLVVGAGPFSRTDDPASGASLLRFAAVEGIAEHAALTAGSWPETGATPLQTAVSEGAASALGVRPGDRMTLVSRQPGAAPVDVVVGGTWRPDTADPFWFNDVQLLTGTRTEGGFTTLGPLVVALDDLLARASVPQLDVAWRAFPTVERLASDDVDALGTSVATADERLRAALPPPPAITVSTHLPATLASVATSVTVSRAGVLVLTLEFAVLAGYAIVMVGGMLADRRRGEVALLRSRGASTGALVTLSLGEALLLTVPAVVLAPILAVVLVRVVGDVGPLAGARAIADPRISATALAAALLAGLACLVALAAPAVVSASSPAGERAASARPVGGGLVGRLGVDLVLVVIAALALWQLRLYGAPLSRDARGALGVDPLLIAAPALTLLAGALVGTRLLPRLAELASPFASRARGPVLPLVTWGLARRPRRAVRATLLLMLAAALGTFAAVYQATWARSQADQATQRAGADVRATMSDYPTLPDWAVGPALRALPGVAAAAPVGIRSLGSGRVIRDGTLVATQADDLAAAMVTRPGDAVDGLPAVARRLADARTEAPGAVIAPGTTELAVTVGGLRSSDWAGIPVDEPRSRAQIVAVLANADGVHRLPLGSMPLTPGPQRLVGALGERPRRARWRRRFRRGCWRWRWWPQLDPTELVTGSLSLSSVEMVSPDGIVRADLPVADPDAGWVWLALAPGSPARPVGAPSGTVEVGTDAPGALPSIIGSPSPPTTFRLQVAPAPGSDLAAVASDAFLTATGARVGDAVAATVSGLPVTLRLIERVAAVPGRDPAEPVVVVDAPTLGDLELLGIGRLAPAREWWLSTTADLAAEVPEAAQAAPGGVADPRPGSWRRSSARRSAPRISWAGMPWRGCSARIPWPLASSARWRSARSPRS